MTRRTMGRVLGGALAALGVTVPVIGARQESPVTIDELIDIKHPSNPVWSRDSRHVAFRWERAGVANLYVVPADGSGKPVAVTSDGVAVAGVSWSQDDRLLYFARGGTLMQAPADGSQPPRPVWPQPPGRGLAVSLDGTRVA